MRLKSVRYSAAGGFNGATILSLYLGQLTEHSIKFGGIFVDEELCFATTVDPRFMVAFDSDERRKRAVDTTIGVMEGATGMSQQADQPSVPPASAQASKPLSSWSKVDKLLPVMERHRCIILRMRCVTSLRAICGSPKSLGRHRHNDDFLIH